MDKKIKMLLFIAFVVLFICGAISFVNAQAGIAFRYFYGSANCPAVSGLTLRGVLGSYNMAFPNTSTETNCSTNLLCICFYSLL
jgi:Ca2+/Na+ antiporter